MNAIGATLMPRITVVTQPAHSPDMNVNDLGLFRALDVKVQRRSRSMKRGRMDPEQLAKDVEATYAAFDIIYIYSRPIVTACLYSSALLVAELGSCLHP